MLRPLYTRRATQVLLVGPPASGKRTLARQLLRSPKIFYSTKTLERMDTVYFDRLVDIDFVLILVDMTNTSSLELLKDTLMYMEPDYLLCKCAIVFTKVDLVNLWMLDEDHVRRIIEQYGNPYTFYINLQDGLIRTKIVEQITRVICIGTSQHRQVHPLGMRLLNNRVFIQNINNDDSVGLQSENDQSGQGQSEQDYSDQGQSDQGQSDQGQSDQGQSDQGHSDQGQSEQDYSDQGQSDQGPSEQDYSDQGQSDQGQSDQGQSEQDYSDQGQSEQGE